MKWYLVTEDFPPDFIGGIATWSYAIAQTLFQNQTDITVLARQTPNANDFDTKLNFPIKRMRGFYERLFEEGATFPTGCQGCQRDEGASMVQRLRATWLECT